MKNHNPDNTPNINHDFQKSNHNNEKTTPHDAQNWKPTTDPHIEDPSEKHAEMHHTPGGHLEQDVHSQLDEAARRNIANAQRNHQNETQSPTFHKQFEDASHWHDRDYDAEKEAIQEFDDDKEFEKHLKQQKEDQPTNRFNERSHRDPEWEH